MFSPAVNAFRLFICLVLQSQVSLVFIIVVAVIITVYLFCCCCFNTTKLFYFFFLFVIGSRLVNLELFQISQRVFFVCALLFQQSFFLLAISIMLFCFCFVLFSCRDSRQQIQLPQIFDTCKYCNMYYNFFLFRFLHDPFAVALNLIRS